MDGLGTVQVTPVYGYTLTYGGGSIAVAIHGEWQSTDGPGSVKVTTVFGDTLT